MIELKKLTKVYVTKAGEVRALDDVSVTLPDRGMVFILGKSGSGKSTMLNVVGGLDRVTSGEIIIDGKSSASFNDGDFDAYRNTYIGFVFQEYNLLDDFTVAENVALATNLQGLRNADHIEHILETVDLGGMGNRKPSTLSGGQKQRVALARALVKNPAVIMADEPTGALDSETGEQIFQTLKNLSREKLVVVVSHDRDFAQRYGDRLIELEDGKIVGDTANQSSAAQKFSEDVALSGSSVLVKEGAIMNEVNVKALRRALSAAPDGKIVFHSEQEMRLATETTAEQAEEDVVRPPLKLIRSRLPLTKAVRMGASSMKKKPLRLAITILLSAIAFGLFGISDTMLAYNRVNATVNTIKDQKIDYATFDKFVTVTTTDIESGESLEGDRSSPAFNEQDILAIKEKTGLTAYPFYTVAGDLQNVKTKTAFYNQKISGCIEVSPETFAALGYKLIGENSRLPNDFTEIVLTKYHYDHYEELGFYDFDDGATEVIAITSPDDLIGKTIRVSTYGQMTIVGIVDTGTDERYSHLDKTIKDLSGQMDLTTTNEWKSFQAEIANSFHSALFVAPGFANKHMKKYQAMEDAVYYRVIAQMPTKKRAIKRIVKFAETPVVTEVVSVTGLTKTTTETTYELLNKSAANLERADFVVKNLSEIFLYAGLGCALFAALLLYNFISVSIQHKKREIGILRALGARKTDVFLIFLAECLLISLFAWGVACVMAGIGPIVINNILNDHLGVDVTLLSFGIRQLLVMLGFSMAIGVIGCFLPTYRAARKKPVEAIRG